MDDVKRWTVIVDTDLHEGRTGPVTRPHTRDTDHHLVARGSARQLAGTPETRLSR